MICQQPHNNIMQRAQLRYAADDERYPYEPDFFGDT
jgi:hypothetical protein